MWTTPLVKEQVRAQSINQNGGANEVEVSGLQVKGKFLYSTSDTKQLTAEKRRAGAFIPSFEERGRAASALDFPSSLGVL